MTPADPNVFPDLAAIRRWLSAGEPLRAYDLSETWPEAARNADFHRVQALALARTGATRQALARLARALDAGPEDEETLGIQARLHKDLADQAPSAERVAALRGARDRYAAVFHRFGGAWPAINAATLSLDLGEAAEAATFARAAREASIQAGADDLWSQATLGDAALLLGDDALAQEAHGRAAALARGRWGDLASMRRNTRRILQAQGRGPEALGALLPAPQVCVFTGHRLDEPGRTPPRFPAQAEGAVAAALAEAVRRHDVAFAVAGAANGGDLLFLEAVLAAGGGVHVVLPCAAEAFRAASVGEDPAWVRRFETVLARASQVTVVSQGGDPSDPVLLRLANRILLGLGRLKAEEWCTSLLTLGLWAPGREGAPGGTADALATFLRAGERPWVVAVEAGGPGGPTVSQAHPMAAPPPAVETPEGLGAKPFLFADVKGFSRLSDAQIPRYVDHFLGGVAAFARGRADVPRAAGTWGDALFFGFDDLEGAGRFALELAAWVRVQPWADLGLPGDFSLRMALHVGPVTAVRDPITGLDTFFGSALVRAARMEPITPPGEVYASLEFAALAALQCPGVFRCEVVGHLPLPKGYGTFPVVHLQPGWEA